MILATHALVGAAIGKSLANPWIVIPVSVAIHYAIDAIPHGEYLDKNSSIKSTWWKIALDLSIGIAIVIFYVFIKKDTGIRTVNIALGVFFSLLPDLLTLLYWKLDLSFLKKAYDFHGWVHKLISQKEFGWNLWNARNDILVSLVSIIFLFL